MREGQDTPDGNGKFDGVDGISFTLRASGVVVFRATLRDTLGGAGDIILECFPQWCAMCFLESWHGGLLAGPASTGDQGV